MRLFMQILAVAFGVAATIISIAAFNISTGITTVFQEIGVILLWIFAVLLWIAFILCCIGISVSVEFPVVPTNPEPQRYDAPPAGGVPQGPKMSPEKYKSEIARQNAQSSGQNTINR